MTVLLIDFNRGKNVMTYMKRQIYEEKQSYRKRFDSIKSCFRDKHWKHIKVCLLILKEFYGLLHLFVL